MVTPDSPVPPVPSPFNPQAVTLPAGSVLHRVFGNAREVTDFNPGMGNPTRFAFFGDPSVAVLYAAGDLKTAVCESMLHDIPYKGGVLFKARYEDRVSAGLRTGRDLRLASFKGEGLRALGVEPHELTSCEAIWYPDTVEWARAAYDAGYDGCVWMSRRLNDGLAYVFFDRAEDAFSTDTSVPAGAYLNGPDLDWLIDFCAGINIDVEV